jgi:hypothetical protein
MPPIIILSAPLLGWGILSKDNQGKYPGFLGIFQ